MAMDNIKIGGRISEINVMNFIMQKMNQNSLGLKFKMGLDSNLLWYRPNNANSRAINEEYVYNELTYEYSVDKFIPMFIVIKDMGLSSGLDFLSGSVAVELIFDVNIDDPQTSELTRIAIEEIRDVLRQGFYVVPIPQRPYNSESPITNKNFKFNTNTGTITLSSNIETINGKQFVQYSLDLDIEFTDMAVIGNEFLIEMAIKTGTDSYSSYERMYPLGLDMSMVASTEDKQELVLEIIDKEFGDSSLSEYNASPFKYDAPINTPIGELNPQDFDLGTIIKTVVTSPNWVNLGAIGGAYPTCDTCPPTGEQTVGYRCGCDDDVWEYTGLSTITDYYKVNSPSYDAFEEKKAWENHSVWNNKAFALSMDLIYREQHAHETVGIIEHLFNDLVLERYGYNVYKIRVSRYILQPNGTWTLSRVLFDRHFLLTKNETNIELGAGMGMPCNFVVSDVK